MNKLDEIKEIDELSLVMGWGDDQLFKVEPKINELITVINQLSEERNNTKEREKQ